jgi:hypothetical protein
MHSIANRAFAVIVINDARYLDSLVPQPLHGRLKPFRRHIEGDVVHGTMGRDDVSTAGHFRRGGDTERLARSMRKPKKRNT